MFGKKKQQPITGRQRPATEQRGGATVFSYHSASRNAVRPQAGNTGRDVYAQARGQSAAADRAAAAHGKSGVRRASLLVGLALLAALAFNSLFVSATPRLEIVGGSRNNALLRGKEDIYTRAAAQLMNDSLANRTKITVQTDKVAAELATRFPELGSVKLLLPVFGHQPRLRVEPAVPALIMSGAASQSFILDATGRALMTPTQAPHSSKLGLPVVTDQSGLSIVSGRQALPSSTVHFITEVVGQLKAAKLSVAGLTLPRATSELDVRLEGQPYFVKFNLMGNARAEAGAFLAVKRQLEREKKTPSAYIDVRVEGRAYYK